MTQQNSQNKRNAFSRKISKLNKGFRQNLFQIIIKNPVLNFVHCITGKQFYYVVVNQSHHSVHKRKEKKQRVVFHGNS